MKVLLKLHKNKAIKSRVLIKTIQNIGRPLKYSETLKTAQNFRDLCKIA